MKRRRTSFATPFVITAACGGAPAPPPADPPGPVEHDPTSYTSPEALFDPPPLKTKPSTQPDAGLPDPSEPALIVDPNLRLPQKREVTIGRDRYRIEEESFLCRREIMGNPPGWERSECPPQLLPELVGGIVPDEKCMYRGVKVKAANCMPPVRGVTTARIINAAIVPTGVEVTIAAGRRHGVDRGATVQIVGVGRATLTACTENMCRAVFKATLDQIKAAPAGVTIETTD